MITITKRRETRNEKTAKKKKTCTKQLTARKKSRDELIQDKVTNRLKFDQSELNPFYILYPSILISIERQSKILLSRLGEGEEQKIKVYAPWSNSNAGLDGEMQVFQLVESRCYSHIRKFPAAMASVANFSTIALRSLRVVETRESCIG